MFVVAGKSQTFWRRFPLKEPKATQGLAAFASFPGPERGGALVPRGTALRPGPGRGPGLPAAALQDPPEAPGFGPRALAFQTRFGAGIWIRLIWERPGNTEIFQQGACVFEAGGPSKIWTAGCFPSKWARNGGGGQSFS